MDVGSVRTGDDGPTRAQLVEMLRKSRNVDIVDLIGYVDALTDRLDAVERQRDEARRFLSGQHAMVASGHSHSLLLHEHQCTLDAMQGIEVREREAITRAERAERERDDARRMLERATPWAVRHEGEPTTEEMRAIRSRWGTGPEKYQADADALICGIVHARARADAAEKKLDALAKAASQAVYATVAAEVFGDNGHAAAVRALDAAIARSKP